MNELNIFINKILNFKINKYNTHLLDYCKYIHFDQFVSLNKIINLNNNISINQIFNNENNLINIHIINLKHRKDKKKFMIDQLDRLGIIKYTFFEAIKIKKEELNNYKCIKSENFLNFLNIDYVTNSAGCKISHYELIKSLIKDSSKYTLVLEDDVVLEHNFYAYIINALYTLQNNEELFDFDLLYLGCNLNKKNDAELIYPNLLKVKYPKTTTAYLINNNKSCINKIINAIENSFNEIDNTYADSISLNKYCIYPMIAYQKDFSSDIVDYANYKYYHDKFTYELDY